MAVFIGALGDRRKGFDRLLEAWRCLCGDAGWDVGLAVVGAGSELEAWRRRAIDGGVDRHVTFLGFRSDVPRILAASDLLVHPARYEAYGLGVHEAICRGLPAIVSASAGIAELYPADLHDWLIADVEDAREIADRVRRWRTGLEAAATRVRPFSERLRARSWATMAAEFQQAVSS
jgi:glycosyltransferase involved in cell wall biosynthesis